MTVIRRRICAAILLAATAVPVVTFAQAGTSAPAVSENALPTHKQMRKADRALERKVLSAMTKAKINVLNISVLVKGSAVTLVGSVPEAGQVDRAGDVTKKVAGVATVDNRLSQGDKHQ